MPTSRCRSVLQLLAAIALLSPNLLAQIISPGDKVEVVDEQVLIEGRNGGRVMVDVGDRFDVRRTSGDRVLVDNDGTEAWIDRSAVLEVPKFELGDLVRPSFGSLRFVDGENRVTTVGSSEQLLVVRMSEDGQLTVDRNGELGTVDAGRVSVVTASSGTELMKEHGEREAAFNEAVREQRTPDAAREAMRIVALKRAVLERVTREQPTNRQLAKDIRTGIAGFGDFVGGRLRDLEELDSELWIRRLVVAMRSKVGGPTDWRTASAIAEYRYARELADADESRRDELRAADRAFGEADRLLRSGDFFEAANRLSENLAERKRLLGDKHLLYAVSLHNLAFAHDRLNQPDKAEPLYRESLGVVAVTLGKEHPEYATRLCNLGVLARKRGAFEEAEPLIRECLEVRAKAFGDENGATIGSARELASLYERLEEPAKAAELRNRFPQLNEAE